MTIKITDIVNVGEYKGFVGSDAPSLTLKRGSQSVKFSILSSGNRFNITKFNGRKACGWMSMVDSASASLKLNALIAGCIPSAYVLDSCEVS